MIYSKEYAKNFDNVYRKPDYSPDRIIQYLKLTKNKKVLDLGCGTGRHSKGLIEKSVNVCGIDASNQMIRIAQDKFPDCTWINCSVCDYDLDDMFDGAFMLGDILSYLTTNLEIVQAFECVRNCLKYDAMFLFDFWYGPAVLSQLPKTTTIRFDGFSREAKSTLDISNNICQVDYKFKTDRVFHEQHLMRYFFKPELEKFLEDASFKLLKFGSMKDLSKEPIIKDWHALILAKAN